MPLVRRANLEVIYRNSIRKFVEYIFVYSSAEKAMALHSSTLTWKTPWTEEPGRLQSMGSLRVRYD